MPKIPRPNARVIPFYLFDHGLGLYRTWAEEKVVLFVARHTIGWSINKSDGDWLSIGQFYRGKRKRDGKVICTGLGLSPQAIREGIALALEDGWIKRKRLCANCGLEVEQDQEESISYVPKSGKHAGRVISYTRKVVPPLCPHCDTPLRGREKLFFSLNWDETEGDEE